MKITVFVDFNNEEFEHNRNYNFGEFVYPEYAMQGDAAPLSFLFGDNDLAFRTHGLLSRISPNNDYLLA
ncbi:12535_t:CDS:2, partial [Acaulospora morrowiae]